MNCIHRAGNNGIQNKYLLMIFSYISINTKNKQTKKNVENKKKTDIEYNRYEVV